MKLSAILAPLDAADRDRAAAAIRLLMRQARGSERYREHVQSWTKDDKSPVTIADLLHQSQVQQLIADRFAGDGLICEEPRSMQEQVVHLAADASEKFYGEPLRREVIDLPTSGRTTWMLDPIDGTKGYLAGRYYAIALGYYVDGRPLFGSMAVPHCPRAEKTAIDDTVAFALVGRGAWIGAVSDAPDPEFAPLRTQRDGFARPWRVAISLEHGGGVDERFGADFSAVKMDSQAKYLAVAANAIDGYLRKMRDDGATDVAWDHMPGIVIAREAGCTVRSFGGGAVELRAEKTIRFDGGMMCHRGAPESDLGRALDRLVRG